MKCTISQRNKISTQLSKKQEVDPIVELIEVVKLMVSSFPRLTKTKMLGLVQDNKIIGNRCRSQLSYLLSTEEIQGIFPELKQDVPVNVNMSRNAEEIFQTPEQQEDVQVVVEHEYRNSCMVKECDFSSTCCNLLG